MVTPTPFLQRANDAPFVSLDTVASGDVLLLAPHPDDETLGCGCAIAALTDLGQRVQVVVITDGSKSHPGSATYHPSRLAQTREGEVTEALRILTDGRGPPPIFLRYPDMFAPDGDVAAELAAQRILAMMVPSTRSIWATWEGDPHPDHGRTARIMAKLGGHVPEVARWSYPIWGRFRRDEAPVDPLRIVRLQPNGHLARKRLALAAHRTQMSGLITDCPGGFVMPKDEQEHFLTAPEIFIRSH